MSAACKKPFKRKRFSKPQQMKTKFRSSARWSKFRKKLKAMQVLDPVTGAELDSKYTVHHLDMDELNYCNLDHPENFICLNETSHSMVHFLRDSAHGWRYAIMALIKIMKHMDRIAAQKQAKELAKERAVA